eukprot:768775-Hanusia_phi.AAC.5
MGNRGPGEVNPAKQTSCRSNCPSFSRSQSTGLPDDDPVNLYRDHQRRSKGLELGRSTIEEEQSSLETSCDMFFGSLKMSATDEKTESEPQAVAQDASKEEKVEEKVETKVRPTCQDI